MNTKYAQSKLYVNISPNAFFNFPNFPLFAHPQDLRIYPFFLPKGLRTQNWCNMQVPYTTVN